MIMNARYKDAEIATAKTSGGASLLSLAQWLICVFFDCKISVFGFFEFSVNAEAGEFSHLTILGVFFGLIICPFQIYAARHNIIALRHYTNIFSFIACGITAFSLLNGVGGASAIGGYGIVSYLNIEYARYTHGILKRIKNANRP